METSILSTLPKEQRLQLLNKLLEKAKEVTKTNINDPSFQGWKILIERTFKTIYGEGSIELNEFRKLKFQFEPLNKIVYHPDAAQNENMFKLDFDTAKRLISQCLEDVYDETENIHQVSNKAPTLSIATKNNLPKIKWQGTQKELGELFIELKRKGWLNEINPDLIQNYFSDSNTIKQVLKPHLDKATNENLYNEIYTKAYKPKFDAIKPNQKQNK